MATDSPTRRRAGGPLGAWLACLLLAACGAHGEEGSILVRVVDAGGGPARGARVLERSARRTESRARWDAANATVHLPRSGAPYDLHVAAVGRRLERLSGVAEHREVVLRPGLRVVVRRGGAAPAPKPPQQIVWRLRPATEADPATDEAARARVSEVCELVAPAGTAEEDSLPLLPTAGWGFAAAEADAARGLLLPEPGAYVVSWGLLDREAAIWMGGAVAPTRFAVPPDGAPVEVVVEVPPDALARAGAALAEQVARAAREGKEAIVKDVPRVERSDEEWRKRLSPEAFHVLRRGGTERPFTGAYDKFFDVGTYHCAACGLALFRSDAKFDSGCGWPAFFEPLAGAHMEEIEDRSHGMVRTEVRCKGCGSHLGHVFPDGPAPTGLRYCINSVCLRHEPEEKDEAEGASGE